MIVSGVGITSFEMKIISFDPNIELSLNWFEMGDSSWDASDRTSANDHISTEIVLSGREDYIDNVIEQLNNNRINGDAVIVLSNVSEPIFGHHVDYNEMVTCVLEKTTLKKQKSFRGFSLSLIFRASNITFKSYLLELPDLSCLVHSSTTDTIQNFMISTSYNNMFSNGVGFNSGEINTTSFDSDSGIFIGSYQLSYEETGKLLNYQRIQRAFPFSLPYLGKPFPFGKLAGDIGLVGRLKKVKLLGRISSNLFRVEITIVQEF